LRGIGQHPIRFKCRQYFRTSDAFRIEKIYCVGITAAPPHREILKTALGATESVEWTYIKNISDLAKELKAKGFEWVVLEQADPATDLRDFKIDRNKKYAIVFGNEVGGVVR
jgi:23S rRNA (guanosine2251-2'-O)-methyltransferase